MLIAIVDTAWIYMLIQCFNIVTPAFVPAVV